MIIRVRAAAPVRPIAMGLAAALLIALAFEAHGSGGGETASAPGQLVGSKFELFVSNANQSSRFYRTLGFTVAHEKADGYTTLRSGTTVIALSPVPWWLPLGLVRVLRYPPIGTEIVLYTDHLDQLRAALVAAGYSPGAVQLQPWGDRDFRVTDHDGYYVRVSEGHAVP